MKVTLIEYTGSGHPDPAKHAMAILAFTKSTRLTMSPGLFAEIMAKAKARDCAIVLPSDGVVAKEFKAGAANDVVDIDKVPADSMILDVGPKTAAKFAALLNALGVHESAPVIEPAA